MKTKYADLIKQLECVTEAYERALAEFKALEATTGDRPDVLGVSGSIIYLGDGFENRRAIHLGAKVFTAAAADCGSDFQHGESGDKFTRVDCTVFGYRVFALVHKDSAEEACLLDLAEDLGSAQEKDGWTPQEIEAAAFKDACEEYTLKEVVGDAVLSDWAVAVTVDASGEVWEHGGNPYVDDVDMVWLNPKGRFNRINKVVQPFNFKNCIWRVNK